jgi:hypothetical protein
MNLSVTCLWDLELNLLSHFWESFV